MSSAAPDVSLLFGPMLIGVFLNTMLYGVMLVQASLYYHRYRGRVPFGIHLFHDLPLQIILSDRQWFRYLVLYLVIVETVDVICDAAIVYEPLIIRYATPEALSSSPLFLRAGRSLLCLWHVLFYTNSPPVPKDGFLTVMVSTPIQLFIAWRIQVVTSSFLLPALISILALVSFGAGIATTIIISLHPGFTSFSHLHPEVVTWLSASALCDLLLTAALVHSLWTRKTNVVANDSYINKIIRLTVQTGFITAAAAFLDMLFFLLIRNTTFNFMIDFALSKLYTNALISTLNARPWREELTHHDVPNALFEQTRTPVGRTSFSLGHIPHSPPGMGYPSSHPPLDDSYMTRSNTLKFTLDIDSVP
ncbi:hypothetical protein B0H19DRAFT_1370757 [Mycena capillaripes]|nr:hypothetical protein B0H19DRAFT_1370757 [Mycena capillaripes]